MITLRDGVRDDSNEHSVRLIDEHGVLIEVPRKGESVEDELVEIMWLGEDGSKPIPSLGQSVHPLDLLHALALAGWDLEGRQA